MQAPGVSTAGSARSFPAPSGHSPPGPALSPAPSPAAWPGLLFLVRLLGAPAAGAQHPTTSPGRFGDPRDRLILSPALQGSRLCCKQEPAHYINIIYPSVQKPSGCLPFSRRHLPASAPLALLPRTLQTAEPQRRYLQRALANLKSPRPARPSGK